MSKRDPNVRLLHMRNYAHKAVAMVQGQARRDLDSDEKLRLALTHLVELVGEAASQVPAGVRKQYPQVPWMKAIAMRHRLVHGYDQIDFDILWRILSVELPGILEQLEAILAENHKNES